MLVENVARVTVLRKRFLNKNNQDRLGLFGECCDLFFLFGFKKPVNFWRFTINGELRAG
jgi:hypothetical protein